MLKYISFLILFLYLNQLHAQNFFQIDGLFKNYDGVIYLKYDFKEDSAIVKNGQFEFRGSINLPTPAHMRINDARQVWFTEFILESGELTVQVDSTTENYNNQPSLLIKTEVLEGGKTNALLDSFRKNTMAKGSELQGKSVPEKKQFFIQELKQFLTDHPNEIASLILLEQASSGFSQQELMSYYKNFDDHLKKGYHGAKIKTVIEKNKKAAIGTTIRDFEQPDLTGKPVSISSLRGKFVLIDFWASWCGPCRTENPNLLKIYEKYKNEGFEILGVSLDTDAEKWSKAIEKDNLSWLNVSDLKAKNEVATMFNIRGIPDNILIDREGRIIAKKISWHELDQLLKKELL